MITTVWVGIKNCLKYQKVISIMSYIGMKDETEIHRVNYAKHMI